MLVLHLFDALQLRCYKQPHTVASQAESCICSMHFNYVATRVFFCVMANHLLHLSDALQLRCYHRSELDHLLADQLHLRDAL